MLSTHSNLLIGAPDLKRKKGPTMNIIQEILRHDDEDQDDQLESPQVRRRLSLVLRCRECRKAGGCRGCVIEIKRGKVKKQPPDLTAGEFNRSE